MKVKLNDEELAKAVLELHDRGHVLVLLQEEYGFREWAWLTDKTPEELRAFWEGLESVGQYFFDPSGLPGRMVEIDDSAHYDEDEQHEFWFTPAKKVRLSWRTDPLVWGGHIHMEDDSSLMVDAEIRVLHKGYGRFP